jgi:hypothetical protein
MDDPFHGVVRVSCIPILGDVEGMGGVNGRLDSCACVIASAAAGTW